MQTDNLPKKESLSIEFKSDRGNSGKGYPVNDLIDEIVGMTNTEGGTLYLGIEDDGRITGIISAHQDPIRLAALIANKTRPSLSVRTEVIYAQNLPIMAIHIPKSYSIVASASGKILKRRLKIDGTPEVIPMYPYEIYTRLSDLRKLDFSAQPIKDGSLEDLDPNQLIRLRETIQNQNGEQSLLTLTDEELAQALQFTARVGEKVYPTLTGLLLIGKENSLRKLVPTAKADFQVLQGTNVVINESYCKPIIELVELFSEYMKPWNPEKEFDYGLFRIPIPEFSKPAFREGLINAFAHRDYSVLGSVHVQLTDEGLTISSPGGFIDGISLDNLLTAEPYGRNPTLSDALKRIGLAERTGRGIDRIFEGSITFGRPWPDYSASTTKNVVLFIPRAKADLPFIRIVMDEQKSIGHPLSINTLLVLSALYSERKMSSKDLSEKTHIQLSRLKPMMEMLIERGLVEEIGRGHNRMFMLGCSPYTKTGKAKEYTRQRGIDSVRFPEMVLTLAKRQNGSITKNDVVELLHITKTQAYTILQTLCKEKKLKIIGKGRYSYYKIVQ